MNVLSAENVYKSYGEKVLLDRVTFGIDAGDRIGIIGVNGTGKSTFLKMLARLEWPESGTITLGNRITVHYLPQEPQFEPGATVLQQVFHGDLPEMKLLRDYEEVLGDALAAPSSTELQDRLIRLQTRMDEANVWNLEHEAKTVLTRLGVTDFHAKVEFLSGGQRKRVALARALIQPSDVLLLDEPTNHIDDATVMWLEMYLQKRPGALVMVTHDRYFLDRVVNRIFEIHRGKLYQYPGNYEAFLDAKWAREADQKASEEKRQNFLRNELEWVKRGPKARGTKQKARTDRYYDVLEQTPDMDDASLDLSSVTSRLGRTIIELANVSHSFENRRLIRDFSYILLRDDRIGIIGPNGAGKSTLLKIMGGRLPPDEGLVTIGSTVKIGYFSQEHEDMNGEQRVIDYIRDVADYVETADGNSISAAQMLERFLFPGSLQWTPIQKLSGGEKRRLALLRTLMTAPNVLLLDEPTNDLDIPTLSILESYVEDFSGAVVVVSHDRYFLDKVVDKVFALEGNGKVSQYFGNFSDYLDKRTPDATINEQSRAEEKSANASPTAPPSKRAALKFTYKEQKEFEEIDDKIAGVEAALKRVNAALEAAGGDYDKVQELYTEQQTLESTLSALIERWTELNELAEEIERSKKNPD